MAKALHLTLREKEIVGHLARGARNKEIASAMGITEGTVKVYLAKIFHKFPQYTRYSFPLLLAENYARDRAVELNAWVVKHQDSLSPDALLEIQIIVARQVAEFLKV